jgi:hypothetical protein
MRSLRAYVQQRFFTPPLPHFSMHKPVLAQDIEREHCIRIDNAGEQLSLMFGSLSEYHR